MNSDFLTLGVKKNNGFVNIVALELTSQNIVELDLGTLSDSQLALVTQWQIGYITSCHDVESYSSKKGMKYKPVGNRLVPTTKNQGKFMLDAKASYPIKSLSNDKYHYSILKVNRLEAIYTEDDEYIIEATFERILRPLKIKIGDSKWIKYWANCCDEDFGDKVGWLKSYVNRYERRMYLIVEKMDNLNCISLIVY